MQHIAWRGLVVIQKVVVWKDLLLCTGLLEKLTEPCVMRSKPVQQRLSDMSILPFACGRLSNQDCV